MKIGELDVSKIMLGGSEIEKIYLGTDQVYGGSEPQPTPSYDEQYLTFVAKESGTFKFSGNSIDYSIDSGNTWTTLASNTDSPTVASGDTIMWKASGLTPTTDGIGTFSSTGGFDVEGNVMSLLYGDNFSGQTTIQNNQFKFLFDGATHITSAENMILPATTLADACYAYMFRNCTSLTTAPELPATTLASYCYLQMFMGCSNLTTAPALSATTLANYCYQSMFQGCTSLTTSPVLPATTLARSCYNSMFLNCSSLEYVECLATDISARSCTSNWVEGVSATGTFVKAASMNDWTRGASGIPNDWTVIEE